MEDGHQVSKAIIAWYDPDKPYPDPNDARVIGEFGEEVGRELLVRLTELRDEFLESDAYRTVPGLAEMAEKARTEFSAKHPEVSPEATKLLANDYAFANK